MSPLSILFITVFIDLLGFGIVVPFLAYYVESFGASAASVGLLMSSYSLAQLVFAPLWGKLSDRIGRRPILLLGLAGSAVGFTLFGLAGSVAMLFAGRIIAGIAGANIPTAQAYIADVTPPERRARGMGVIGAAFGLGFIFGPAIGGLLARASPHLAAALPAGWFARLIAENPYALPSLAAALLAGLNFTVALFRLPESLPEALRAGARSRARAGRWSELLAAFSDRRLGTLIAVFFLSTAGFSMMEATLTLLAERHLGGGAGVAAHAVLAGRVGYLFAFIGVIAATLQGWLVGRLAPRFGEQRLLVSGLALVSLALGAFPFAASWPAFFGCAGVLALGSGLSSPSISSLISRAVSADRQGGTFGISQSASSLARVLGPAAGGVLFQELAPGAPYGVSAVLVLIACVLALRLQNSQIGGRDDRAPIDNESLQVPNRDPPGVSSGHPKPIA